MTQYRESTCLGPTNRSKCPHCHNSLQNATPWKSYDLIRCASCKNIFYPYPCFEELARMIHEIWKERPVGAGDLPIEYLAMIECMTIKIEEEIKTRANYQLMIQAASHMP
jgi:hypothetical protein